MFYAYSIQKPNEIKSCLRLEKFNLGGSRIIEVQLYIPNLKISSENNVHSKAYILTEIRNIP